jgi:transcriptional regulator GlxA family with amidase domain
MRPTDFPAMADLVLPTPLPPRCRRVLVLAMSPAQLLDVAGPIEVLSQAGRLRALEHGHAPCARTLYDVAFHLVGGTATTAGLPLTSTVSERSLFAGPAFDTLIVVGGQGALAHAAEPTLQRLVRHLAPRARRVVGVCTGAFILAAAGLLRGRAATTHWRWCAELARRHPDLTVEPNPIYLRDGHVWTSAGITAGMDLALALVEEDHGHTLALSIARELVLFLRRPGDQKQFSTVLSAQTGPAARLGDLLAWMEENLNRPLPVGVLAARACLSPRQFVRVFQAETGTTPARMVERLRVDAARRRLEQGRVRLATVAASCGFGTEETMRRAFLRHLGIAPGEYRDRFRRSGAGPSVRGAMEIRP